MQTETKAISKIENIKNLYNQLNHKGKFIELVAEDLGGKPLSIKNNWFSGFISIPDEHQDRVIELLQNTIKQQNDNAA